MAGYVKPNPNTLMIKLRLLHVQYKVLYLHVGMLVYWNTSGLSEVSTY